MPLGQNPSSFHFNYHDSVDNQICEVLSDDFTRIQNLDSYLVPDRQSEFLQLEEQRFDLHSFEKAIAERVVHSIERPDYLFRNLGMLVLDPRILSHHLR